MLCEIQQNFRNKETLFLLMESLDKGVQIVPFIHRPQSFAMRQMHEQKPKHTHSNNKQSYHSLSSLCKKYRNF